MTSAGDYALGIAGLAVVAVAVSGGAVALRRLALPLWTGAPARLAEAILALFLLIVISELLGVIGLLEPAPLLLACVGAGAGLWWLQQKGAAPRSPPPPPAAPAAWQTWTAAAIALVVIAQWAVPTLEALDRGIYGGDSLWYHMPFAAAFARQGSITALHQVDPLYLNWFYPQSSELLHSLGLIFLDVDFLSPLINLGWLGLALLAGWCIGRPYGAGAPGVAAVALLMSANLHFSRQPGNANNDAMGLALLLSAVALLVADRGWRNGGPPHVLAVAGLAAGLALGTKLTFVVPVLALAIGVVAIAPGRRDRAAAATAGGLLLGGGFWYLRNLIAAGNPLPWLRLGVGPLALPRSEELHGREEFSVLHYATDGSIWRHWFFPALEERLGDIWPVVLALAAAGVVWAAFRGGAVERMLAAVAMIAAIAYLAIPLGASGPEGMPLGFRLNLRYLAPALAIGLVLLATAVPAATAPAAARAAGASPRAGRPQAWCAGATGLLVLAWLIGAEPFGAFGDGHELGAAMLAAALAGLPLAIAIGAQRGLSRPRLAVAAALLAFAVAAAGWPQLHDYERHRYAQDVAPGPDEHPGDVLDRGLGSVYSWARSVRGAKIGLAGTTGAFFQYGLYGPDSSNDVRYIGRRGPRGSFESIDDCAEFIRVVNAGGYDYVVTTPNYDQDDPDTELPAPQRRWLAPQPGAGEIATDRSFAVFELDRRVTPERCGPSR